MHLLISAGCLLLVATELFDRPEGEASWGKNHMPVFSGNVLI